MTSENEHSDDASGRSTTTSGQLLQLSLRRCYKLGKSTYVRGQRSVNNSVGNVASVIDSAQTRTLEGLLSNTFHKASLRGLAATRLPRSISL